jgi:hypothetical protein
LAASLRATLGDVIGNEPAEHNDAAVLDEYTRGNWARFWTALRACEFLRAAEVSGVSIEMTVTTL